MATLVRFGVSLEKELLDKFDRLIEEKNYANRSEAFRDLIRQELVTKQWREGREIAGAITLTYDHRRRDLVDKLTTIQHEFGELIISSQHVHFDHHNCFEIIAIKGSPKEAQQLVNTLRSVKGVKHGSLSISSVEKEIG